MQRRRGLAGKCFGVAAPERYVCLAVQRLVVLPGTQ
jgi:hypothetical protein